ncbi:hypothetical protein MKW94_006404 [Papaver nudicaule]|uniref:Uncharacterized protein n=1 Tax=Papaver nudicaule TaxID=74823 RepID=A0AA41UXG8_PAPNU|nr:hypothetical protein [Papaver nudicaule]
MGKFANYVYGECKGIVLARPTAIEYAAGFLFGYLVSRNNKMLLSYLVPCLKAMPQFEKLGGSVKKLANSSVNVNKYLEKHAETLARYSETET